MLGVLDLAIDFDRSVRVHATWMRTSVVHFAALVLGGDNRIKLTLWYRSDDAQDQESRPAGGTNRAQGYANSFGLFNRFSIAERLPMTKVDITFTREMAASRLSVTNLVRQQRKSLKKYIYHEPQTRRNDFRNDGTRLNIGASACESAAVSSLEARTASNVSCFLRRTTLQGNTIHIHLRSEVKLALAYMSRH
ncbi:hypothetical protein K438DRAFT_1790469 [Mycena galopus ATCC 62051]|nr:hypothetical protein K438DRAFT_1790469 [Mycena galopus ATCC 62051]